MANSKKRVMRRQSLVSFKRSRPIHPEIVIEFSNPNPTIMRGDEVTGVIRDQAAMIGRIGKKQVVSSIDLRLWEESSRYRMMHFELLLKELGVLMTKEMIDADRKARRRVVKRRATAA